MRLLLLSLLCVLPYALFGKDTKDAKTFSSNSDLRFVENASQITDQHLHSRNDIGFCLPGNGINVFIGSGQLHYQFYKAAISVQKADFFKYLPDTVGTGTEGYRMDVTLVGADSHAIVLKEEEQPATFHYLLPQCNATVHTYNKITYKNVYPNIDWVLYVKNNKAEYDFVVHEGGNPAVIKLRYDGATSITKAANGDLSFTTPIGSITEQAPLAITVDGKKQHHPFCWRTILSALKPGLIKAY